MFRAALIAAASALALGGCTSASSQTMQGGMHNAMHGDAGNHATQNCPGASGDVSAMHTQMMQNGQTMPNGGGGMMQGGAGASGSPMMQGNGQMMQGAQSGAMEHTCPMMQGAQAPNAAPQPASPPPTDPHQH